LLQKSSIGLYTYDAFTFTRQRHKTPPIPPDVLIADIAYSRYFICIAPAAEEALVAHVAQADVRRAPPRPLI